MPKGQLYPKNVLFNSCEALLRRRHREHGEFSLSFALCRWVSVVTFARRMGQAKSERRRAMGMLLYGNNLSTTA